jgi:aspartate racemase
MRPVGLIGGMSSVSTALYYDRMNAEVRRRLGGLHSMECVIWSVDFAEIADLQATGRWDEAGRRLADVAQRLEAAGAQAILLATNTMHKLADEIDAATELPLIHIADATAARIVAAGWKRPGLIATAFTMEQAFYTGRLRGRFGLEPIVPEAKDRADVHRIIYDELCKNVVLDSSQTLFESVASRLVANGADCIILGCTEVTLLLGEGNVSVPVFDTTAIHAAAAVDFALEGAAQAVAAA